MPSSIRAGDVVAGRYHVTDLLAESRGGRFWRAHDAVLGRDVALHLIPAGDARGPALMEAARLSVAVTDRRVLRVLDADELDDLSYVVNEWGQGASLDILLASDGPMSPRRAAWVVAEVAEVVAGAHRVGVTHGRLVPEHVLIDVNGTVRVIGLAVDAALLGLPPAPPATDVVDLVGLLYATLTARWGGMSTSLVPRAPVEEGRVLRPRRVRAGVPRPLDDLCDDVLNGRTARGEEHLTTAEEIADYLRQCVGDPSDVISQEARLAARRRPVVAPPPPRPSLDPAARDRSATPPLGQPTRADEPPQTTQLTQTGETGATGATGEVPEPVVLPAPLAPELSDGAGSATDAAAPTGGVDEHTDEPTDEQPIAGDPGVPDPAAVDTDATQAGMPVFLDGSTDVAWIAARTVAPAPPPPLEEPAAKPLFAPEPSDGSPVRRPRPGTAAEHAPDFWPWESSSSSATGSTGSSGTIPPIDEDFELDDDDRVPGRAPLRVAALIAASMLLLLGLVMGWNLSQGRSPLGGIIDDDPKGRGPTSAGSPSARPTPLTGITADDFDPQASPPEENPDTVGNVVDGDRATTWRTSSYNDQLGPPPGLKTGVGVVLDLGSAVDVRSVTVTFVGSPTKASLYLTDTTPRRVDDLTPVSTETARGTAVTFRLESGSNGRFLTLWLTTLPPVSGGFRGEIAEIVVRS